MGRFPHPRPPSHEGFDRPAASADACSSVGPFETPGPTPGLHCFGMHARRHRTHTRTIPFFFGEGGLQAGDQRTRLAPRHRVVVDKDKNKSRSGAGGRTTGHLGSEEQKDALPRG